MGDRHLATQINLDSIRRRMIRDQADELRQLVRLAHRGQTQRGGAPALLVVVGATKAVGAPAIASNLAMALAMQGRRTVLLDADSSSTSRLRAEGSDHHGSIADVLAGRRSIHEVLQRAPCGVHFVPGFGDDDSLPEPAPAACARLCAELQGLARYADLVIALIGGDGGLLGDALWRSAIGIVLVTTDDTETRLAAYSMVKQRHPEPTGGRIYALVNRASDAALAVETQDRLTDACHRFLGRTIVAAGAVATDNGLESANPLARPLVVQSPRCEASRAIERLAELVWRDFSVPRSGDAAGPHAA